MLEKLIAIDKSVTLFINSLHTPFTDSFWMFMSGRSVWFPLYAIIIGIIFWRLGWKKGLVAVVSLALTILCVDQFANFIKDVVVCRLRPCCDPSMIDAGLHIIETPGKYIYGFFSGHAANSFAFALASTLILGMDPRGFGKAGRWNWYATLIFIWSALVGLSRVFVSKHFLGDVVVGAIVGTLMAWGITRAVFAIAAKLGIK